MLGSGLKLNSTHCTTSVTMNWGYSVEKQALTQRDNPDYSYFYIWCFDHSNVVGKYTFIL